MGTVTQSLELGAEDIVVKPFSVRELVLRVRAICVERLRQKLGRAGHYVETVRSVGYRFRAAP